MHRDALDPQAPARSENPARDLSGGALPVEAQDGPHHAEQSEAALGFPQRVDQDRSAYVRAPAIRPSPQGAPPVPPLPVPSIERRIAPSAPPPPVAAAAQEMVVTGGRIQRLPSQPRDTERYPNAQPNPIRQTATDPVSTFSVDVDTAAYANVRRFLTDGMQERNAATLDVARSHAPPDPAVTPPAPPGRATCRASSRPASAWPRRCA